MPTFRVQVVERTFRMFEREFEAETAQIARELADLSLDNGLGDWDELEDSDDVETYIDWVTRVGRETEEEEEPIVFPPLVSEVADEFDDDGSLENVES